MEAEPLAVLEAVEANLIKAGFRILSRRYDGEPFCMTNYRIERGRWNGTLSLADDFLADMGPSIAEYVVVRLEDRIVNDRLAAGARMEHV